MKWLAGAYQRLVGRLRRITSSGRYLPEIDGLRFVAIFGVFLIHLRIYLANQAAVSFATPVEDDWLARLADHGHYGVQLFFAISGFILALPFAAHHLKGEPRVSLRSYYLRRVTRLEPPYLVSMVLLFGLLVLAGRSARELFPHLLASCFYVHNLVYGEGSAINWVAWSLEIEVQFYLLAPLLGELFRLRRRLARRLAIGALGAAAALLVWGHKVYGYALPWTVLHELQFFLVGFLLADVYLSDWDERPQGHWGWDLVSLGGWPCLLLIGESEWRAAFLLPGLLFLLYVAVFRSRWVRRLFTASFLVTVGGMCYTIYLIHVPVISAVGRWTKAVSLPGSSFAGYLAVQIVLVGVPLLAASAVCFLLLEKPCMRKDWPARLLRGARQAAGSLLRERAGPAQPAAFGQPQEA